MNTVALGSASLDFAWISIWLGNAKKVNAESKDENDPLSPPPPTIGDDKASD